MGSRAAGPGGREGTLSPGGANVNTLGTELLILIFQTDILYLSGQSRCAVCLTGREPDCLSSDKVQAESCVSQNNFPHPNMWNISPSNISQFIHRDSFCFSIFAKMNNG